MNDKQEKQLYDEMFDTEWELIKAVDILASAEWDSPTMKIKIQKLLKQYWKLSNEIDRYDEK